MKNIDGNLAKAFDELDKLNEEQLTGLSFSTPWQYSGSAQNQTTDADGFTRRQSNSINAIDTLSMTREALQEECWNKFQTNPQINTNIRAIMGRLCGLGFETTSEFEEIQDVIEEIEEDPRNRLYNYWPKYVGQTQVSGELHLCFTCHEDGFIEVDFIAPQTISGLSDDDSGIIFHPNKPLFPLFYNIKTASSSTNKLKTNQLGLTEQIPSIYIARYPELLEIARQDYNFKPGFQIHSKSRKKKYSKLGGYYRFIISWDRGLLTRRAVSHLRTVLEWCNYYENLKKWEIDWKKSAGSYLWWFKITDAKAFKLWLKLTDEEKRKTGITAPKTPGCSIVTPPGVELQVLNPNLTKISEQDTDILHMVTSGTNEPEDVATGQSKGTFSSVKASRAPMSDRTSDEIAWFRNFLVHDFWGNIFYLKSMLTGFPRYFSKWEARKFSKTTKKPEFGFVKRRPEKLIDVSFPSSETTNFDALTKGLLGSKHGPVSDTLGIEKAEIAKKLGFGGYGRHRLRKATEDEIYPELIYSMDAESLQEQVEAEPKKSNMDKNKNKDMNKNKNMKQKGKEPDKK